MTGILFVSIAVIAIPVAIVISAFREDVRLVREWKSDHGRQS